MGLLVANISNNSAHIDDCFARCEEIEVGRSEGFRQRVGRERPLISVGQSYCALDEKKSAGETPGNAEYITPDYGTLDDFYAHYVA